VRLWANALLLRKNQYFEIHSYEGRGATALKGEWDLLGDFFDYELPGGDSLHPADGYTLLRRNSPLYFEARLDSESGWIETLRDDPRAVARSRWAVDSTAKLILKNPQPHTLRVSLSTRLRALGKRECTVRVGGEPLETLTVYAEPRMWQKNDFVLPPGETIVEFSTPQGADLIGGRTKKRVTFAVDGFDIRVLGRVE